jgi:hypothetical protein
MGAPDPQDPACGTPACGPKDSPRFQPYGEALRERLQLLSYAFYCCHAALIASFDAGAAEGDRIEGSPFEGDRQYLERLDPRYPPTVHALLDFHSYNYLNAAGEHMRGLGALYDKQEVLISPPVLIRCVLEHSARVVWLLADDQQPEDRAARMYLDLLLSTVERKKTSGRFFGKDSQQYRVSAQMLERIRNEAATIFGEAVVDDHGQHRIRGQQMPRLADCVADLLARLSTNADERDHRGVYDRMSNLTHPMVYPHVEMWKTAIEDGETTFVSAVTPEDHQHHASLAVAAFNEALHDAISYHGWNQAPFEEWREKVAQLLWAPAKS